MHNGYFTWYINKQFSAQERLALFVSGETRLTWTSLLLNELPDAQVYLVGGGVRDVLLGINPEDLDIVISGVPATELESWLIRHGAVSRVESTFGTFKFAPHGLQKSRPIDIALPRTERVGTTHNSGRKDLRIVSSHTTSIGEDLSRRDFTINAMAYNWQNGELIDPFYGQSDLETGTIRTVLNPYDRFYEDATRMLRGLRFASQLGFAIEQKTWGAITENLDILNNTVIDEHGKYIYITPRSAIGKEFLLGFLAHPVHTLHTWEMSGALKLFLPEIEELKLMKSFKGQSAFENTKRILHLLKNSEFIERCGAKYASGNVLVAALCALCETPEKTASHLCTRLHLHQFPKGHLARVDMDTVPWLLCSLSFFENHDPASMRPSHFEKMFATPRGTDLLLLAHAYYAQSGRHSVGRERVHVATRLAASFKEQKNALARLVSGEDVRAFGVRPGPIYRELLDDVRDSQLAHKIHTRQEALVILQKKVGEL